MTTETELRDLLTGDAAGPTGGSGGWDDVVRRGRKRQRSRRVQTVAAIVLVAGVAATVLALAADDPTVDTRPPATDPTDTTVDGGAPTSRNALPYGFRITGVRSHGAFLTLTMLWEFRAPDPCTYFHPRVVESSDQVAIELTGRGDDQGLGWAHCRTWDRDAWATLELDDPLDARTVTNGQGGSELAVVDGRSLLYPNELPAPFVLEEGREGSGQGSALDEDGYRAQARGWRFSWTASQSELGLAINGLTDEDVRFDLSQWLDAECDGDSAEVALRGTAARLCSEAPSGGVSYRLAWEEDGKAIGLDYTSTDEAPLTLDDVLTIAEGLEPLG